LTAKHIWTDRWADPKEIFDGLTDDYDRYRPHYAVASLEYARRYAGTVDRLVDLASGTGILTRSLRAVFPGSEIIGAEPGQDMLIESARKTDVAFGIRWMAARAESLSFADDSIDLIAVGQAMHWFDRAIFYQECRRVLHPGDTLAVFYNNRIKGSAIAQAHEALLERVSPGYWRGYRDYDTYGELRDHPETRDVEQHRHVWDWDRTLPEFIGYIRSTSHYKAALRTMPETRLLAELEHAMAPFADDNGILRVPYETVTTLARFG